MIYIVEDDDNIRKLVSYALNKEGYSVQEFAMPDDFKIALESEIPELVILDIMLPQEDGLSILKKLRGNIETKDLPVIMLTAKSSEFDKVTGLDMGADDYITKPFGMIELVSRVKAVLRRASRQKDSEVYQVGDLYVNVEKHIIELNGKPISLSYKEYCLLITLLEANGKVVKRDELLNRVWGEYYEESRTLDVHIRKLRVKLNDNGTLIQTVKNIGYKIGREVNEQKDI